MLSNGPTIIAGAGLPVPDHAAIAAVRTDTNNEDARLRDVAQRLEASFLAEMLKSAGVGASSESYGGGAGEEHFTSFLREAQAAEMAKAGGIGLAEHLFMALKARRDG